MKIILLMLLGSAAVADEPGSRRRPRPAGVKEGHCFIVDGKQSGALCKKRMPPCSTFKLPLAAMSIDSGILDEKTILKWDKTPQKIKSWEQDADARTWLKESIVWFSQRLTPQLGL